MIKSPPAISIYGTSIKPQLWEYFYNYHANNNKVKFEVIFAGPTKPEWTLPDNFKYIKATVKPIQCAAIAAHHATGELVGLMSDDLYMCEGGLDSIYEEYCKQSRNDNCIVAPRFYNFTHNMDMKNPDPAAPRSAMINSFGDIPVVSFYAKNLYLKTGGYDNRFRWAESDVDLYLRAKILGAKFTYLDISFKELNTRESIPNQNYSHHNNLWRRTNKIDCKTFGNLWSSGYSKRSQKFRPFVFNENCTFKNQGRCEGFKVQPKLL